MIIRIRVERQKGQSVLEAGHEYRTFNYNKSEQFQYEVESCTPGKNRSAVS